MTTDAGDAAEEVGRNAPVRRLARGGLVAYGVVHLLIGWTSLRVAWGSPDRNGADPSGAMKTLAQQPFGKSLLWLIALGMVALALWQASEIVWEKRTGSEGQRVRKYITSGGRAVIYTALAGSAALVALGSSSSSSQSQQRATSGVLALPGGQVLIVAVGLVVIGVGVGMVVKGAKVSIGDEIDLSSMSEATRQVAKRLGQVGYIAKGVAFTVVGGLLGYAALRFNPGQAQGLDGALQAVLAQPYGKVLLSVGSFGFAAFGVYAMLQARFRRM